MVKEHHLEIGQAASTCSDREYASIDRLKMRKSKSINPKNKQQNNNFNQAKLEKLKLRTTIESIGVTVIFTKDASIIDVGDNQSAFLTREIKDKFSIAIWVVQSKSNKPKRNKNKNRISINQLKQL
jgi:hypothetical protein